MKIKLATPSATYLNILHLIDPKNKKTDNIIRDPFTIYPVISVLTGIVIVNNRLRTKSINNLFMIFSF